MSNIAEGFERMKPPEFHRFVTIAKGSCAELRSQLYVALDVDHLNQQAFQNLLSRPEEVGRLLGGLLASIERRRGSS
jgi:four helix bundle protein